MTDNDIYQDIQDILKAVREANDKITQATDGMLENVTRMRGEISVKIAEMRAEIDALKGRRDD